MSNAWVNLPDEKIIKFIFVCEDRCAGIDVMTEISIHKYLIVYDYGS